MHRMQAVDFRETVIFFRCLESKKLSRNELRSAMAAAAATVARQASISVSIAVGRSVGWVLGGQHWRMWLSLEWQWAVCLFKPSSIDPGLGFCDREGGWGSRDSREDIFTGGG